MASEIVRLQDLADRLQAAASKTDPHERICVTQPLVRRVSSEDHISPATIRISDGHREIHFHTSVAAERAIREWVAVLAAERRTHFP